MATILIIDDNETIREGLAHTVRKMGHEALVAASGKKGLSLLKKSGDVGFAITDLKMEGMDGVAVLEAVAAESPDTPTMIITGFGTVETAVEAMKLGAFDFITKPFAPEVVRLKVERALDLYEARRASRGLAAHNDYLREQDEARFAIDDLVGAADSMQSVFRAVHKIARTNSAVLIQGESGTGKELIARALHRLSPRKDGPFIKVNCGAITETLLESELFGHEKGAFTGAVKQKLGRFELAHRGTLLLDEIGDISAAMQVKLLRALQEQEFERVGGEATVKVDVRVVSATNKDLQSEVEAGRFREDLFYRLNVVPVTLPPLRERREDIPRLIEHFVAKLAPRINPEVGRVADDAMARMMAYRWPGNVRELENAVEQSLVFTEGDAITVGALPAFLRAADGSDTLEVPGEMALPEILEDLERQLILKAFREAEGVKTETARRLGIKTSALYYKLDKYGIS